VAAVGLDTIGPGIDLEANTATVGHLGIQFGFFQGFGFEFGQSGNRKHSVNG
jgi:hypothetical protein